MAQELQIIDLIEYRPITKLSEKSNTRLLEKVANAFTDAEQRLFVASFFCYLHYKQTDFVVDMDHVWKWIGFQQKNNAVTVLERHFTVNVDYQTDAVQYTQKTGRGGHNLKKYTLTIQCFKSLCLKAQTKKAEEIHNYYLHLERILLEIMDDDKAEMLAILDEHKAHIHQQTLQLDQKTEELKKVPEQENHKTLLRKYGQINGSLVYVIRVKTFENGSYIIKIGESRKGIRSRLNEFKKKYTPDALILDCFTVHNSVGLEKYLHGHPDIHRAKVTTLAGHETENGLFLIGESLTYQRVIAIIEAAIPQFNEVTAENEQLRTENELLRTQLAMTMSTASASTATDSSATASSASSSSSSSLQCDSSILHEILSMNRELLQKVRTLEQSNNDILSRLNALQTKTTTVFGLPDPHVGPRLQKIHPETLQLVRVYESVTECIKEDPNRKRPSLNKAARENTIYHGFRWKLVERSEDATTLHAVAPTKEIKVQRNGYIAKLNGEKSAILALYLDRKTAARVNGYASISAIDDPVKKKTVKDGHYYELYEECPSVLREKWVAEQGNIVLYHDGIGKFDSTGRLVQEFASRFDCTVREAMSQKTLAKVLDHQVPYKEHTYKTMGEKLYVGQ